MYQADLMPVYAREWAVVIGSAFYRVVALPNKENMTILLGHRGKKNWVSHGFAFLLFLLDHDSALYVWSFELSSSYFADMWVDSVSEKTKWLCGNFADA